jgi:glutathione S-transferase
MLELYHTDHSVYSQKVRVCLGEKKLDYVSREIDIVAGEHQTPQYLLRHGGRCGVRPSTAA